MLRQTGLLATAAVVAALFCTAASAADLTEAKARGIIAPFYDALNQPATKVLQTLFDQSTSPAWMSCGANDACFSRDRVMAAFKNRGEDVPDLTWTIKEVLVADTRIHRARRRSRDPEGKFLGREPYGKELPRDVDRRPHRRERQDCAFISAGRF